eukprot:scaffold8161_cov430-Prasinococcus_capsulatus_cf.AAC.5
MSSSSSSTVEVSEDALHNKVRERLQPLASWTRHPLRRRACGLRASSPTLPGSCVCIWCDLLTALCVPQ